MKDSEVTTDYTCRDCDFSWRGMRPIAWGGENPRRTPVFPCPECRSTDLIADPLGWTYIPPSQDETEDLLA